MTAFISYYEHIAKLSKIANKQTVFLSHLLHMMEFNTEAKQYVVDISPAKKKDIMKKINPESPPVAALKQASQYLNKLQKAGLIKSIGSGRWLIDPISYGGYKYISKGLREKNSKIYETRVFEADNMSVSTYIVDEDGVKHDL